jgi:cytochrome d ubiquinol oxidase subunit I
MDAVTLARIQFATNISFHILFPTITIALGWVLFYFRLQHRRTRNEAWLVAYRLWVKVFALSFALGVVSGVTMSFQFGTNWPGFMERVGNIAGPLLAYEVLTAFFLEATFLSIMLFGIGRVSERVHTIATLLVAGGTTLSAFWILALNSWMQTPAGHQVRDGHLHAVDWVAIVFNPSMPYRVVHVLLASGLTVAFLVAGISAYRWLRGDRADDVRLSMRFGCWLGAVLIPLQILAGDVHGKNTVELQPAKVAAMEGLWDTTRGAPLLLFAVPDEKARENRFEIAIPRAASLIITHQADGLVRGLNDFEGRHPPVSTVFWSFRAMVGTGVAMLAVSWLAAWRLRRGDGTLPKWLLRVLVAMTFSGWVATLAGWYVTEIGRQPFLVYNVLLTRDAASAVPAPLIGVSLSMYLTLYALLLSAYVSVVFHLARKAGTQSDPVPAAASRPPLGGMAGA